MFTPKRDRMSTRSPASSSSVLRVEVKLNREEAARLQEANTQLEKEVNQLRETHTKIKEEVRLETRNKKKRFLEMQQENDEKMHALKKSVADSKVRLEESRKLAMKQKIDSVTESVNDVKSMASSIKSLVETTVSDVTANFSAGSSRMHEITDRPVDSETCTYRNIENRMKSALASLPHAGDFAEFRSRPSIELDNLVVFEAPQEEQEGAPVVIKNVYKFVPLHLVRVFKWINRCLQ